MLDYLISKLEKNYSIVEPKKSKPYQGIIANYIKLDDGILLLVDQGFLVGKGKKTNTLIPIYHSAINYTKDKFQNNNVGFIIYKDGKNFFRAAAPKHYYKAEKRLSLKNYTDEELKRMIFFRPEEKFVYDIKRKLHYYQPESDRLSEGIVTYTFKPVIFDYSHIDSYKRFKPNNKASEKNYIWTNKEYTNKDITLINGNIIEYN
ncbi:MAG: hypothetical protein KatS3mg002_0720 [Candidatus Woesearchaeota archaeon]|nr:MAG: hypothetical protein KatS3mg002_0720 [Candidatus Woesearchaeota archaeon]